jgi:uncharacterized protein (TIGR03435 family)
MYSVSAKIQDGATAAQSYTMLQNLAIERFRMTLHHESGVIDGYELVAVKGDPKLKAAAGESDGAGEFSPDGVTLAYVGVTIANFAGCCKCGSPAGLYRARGVLGIRPLFA